MKARRINLGKIILFAVAVLIAVYVFYQVLSVISPLTTGTAVYYSSYDGVNTTGTIIREETLLYSDAQGVKYFVVGDGEKVSKNGVIANIYASQDAVQYYTNLENMKAKIASIEEVQNYNNTTAVDLDLLNTKIDAALYAVMNSCDDGIFDDTEVKSEELLKLLNRRKISTGEESDFSEVLTTLKSEYAQKEASAPAAVGSVKSDISGYFVSTADGYESLLTSQIIEMLTPESFDSLEPAQNTENAIGKIVSDYTWYIACSIPLSDSAAFKVGDTVKLLTSIKSASELSVTVTAINLGSKDDATIVFSCQNMNGDLATIRTLPLTIVTGEYSGLRIKNNAVRIVDNKTGVYVISGMQAKFVEIEIIHSASGYTLCKQNENTLSNDCLRLYDEVIEKGRNLYDGKIIR